MSSVNDRPEWAQGQEWDGWAKHMDSVRRRLSTGKYIYAYKSGVWVQLVADSVNVSVFSTAAAIAIANIIAADRGMWA